MSSKAPSLLHSFAFRLSLWYALIFVISTSALLVLVYYLVALEFHGKDREIILAKLKQYAAVYHAGGAGALSATALQENNPSDEKSFYVDLITPHFSRPIIVPDEWLGFRLKPGGMELRQFEINRIPKN